jgi:hypothetical protein
MSKKINIQAPQFPILGILGLIFITLKLCGVIGWSWWAVLAPFWFPLSIILGIAVLGVTLMSVVSIMLFLCTVTQTKGKR